MQAAREHDYPPPPVPRRPTPEALQRSVQSCQACDLYRGATQAVMGEGPSGARVMLVGEQPGDREDLAGHPFVGPAGGVMDKGLERAGIAREDAYITNAVKHFRFQERGKRRIHQRPDRWHVQACHPWLQAELKLVAPEAVVLMGLTAAQAVMGTSVRIGEMRGRPLESDLAELVLVTAHPSSILRLRNRHERDIAMEAWVSDLTTVADWLAAR